MLDRLGGTHYAGILEELPLVLEDMPSPACEGMWFQHDSAPLNFARRVLNFDKFPDRCIWRGGLIAWPPSSPNLTSINFYLWECLKITFYATKFGIAAIQLIALRWLQQPLGICLDKQP
jgi:hypothetical protein